MKKVLFALTLACTSLTSCKKTGDDVVKDKDISSAIIGTYRNALNEPTPENVDCEKIWIIERESGDHISIKEKITTIRMQNNTQFIDSVKTNFRHVSVIPDGNNKFLLSFENANIVDSDSTIISGIANISGNLLESSVKLKYMSNELPENKLRLFKKEE